MSTMRSKDWAQLLVTLWVVSLAAWLAAVGEVSGDAVIGLFGAAVGIGSSNAAHRQAVPRVEVTHTQTNGS